ncbi:hypothetical protein ACFV4P_25115 [Kitasatospora sp. NPDC059795]|uniref:hypothetical protein n=1 Tax=Kitasatospora sp. NPDC059795 TaxID=3346949 RepID=UPI0036587767
MPKTVFRRATAALLGAAAIALTAPAGTAAAAGETRNLPSGGTLMPGDYLPTVGAVLEMQNDGNLVLYLEASVGGHGPAVWSSGTWGHPGAHASMQPDGNFVVYSDSGTALWATGSWGNPGAYLTLTEGRLVMSQVQGTPWESHTGLAMADEDFPHGDRSAAVTPARAVDPGHWIQSNTVRLVNQPDGNLVLYRRQDGVPLWSSGTWGRPPASLLLAESPLRSALGLYRTDDGSRTWAVPVTGAAGAYGIVQNDGNFVLYADNGTALWATGTWGRA